MEGALIAGVETISGRIEVRTTPNIKALLQQAIVSSHKTVTKFLLEVGSGAAEDASASRRIFRLDERRWQAFPDILSHPVADKPRFALANK